jgi:hypothetical protein
VKLYAVLLVFIIAVSMLGNPHGIAASIASISAASTGTRSSANYSVSTDSVDFGGTLVSSASYSMNGSAAGPCCGGTTSVPSGGRYVARGGFAGQLYDVIGFVVHPSTPGVADRSMLQLNAARFLDDATRLALSPSAITWSIESGPLASIDANGVATAGTVYTHTDASVRGAFENMSSTVSLTVLNVDSDDLAGYAGDRIDDDWQVQYFGVPPNPWAAPGVDADGSGHGNLFKFVAGLNPLDGSRFTINSAPVPGDSSQMAISFGPIVRGRSYDVRTAESLAMPQWDPLTSSSHIDQGTTRTVIDHEALGARKFYRVEISKP